MATMPRESTFMPTVKCSTCGRQVEISLMGDHLCTGEAEPVPPMPAPSLFDRFALPLPNPFGGLTSAASTEKQSRAPPKVDTSAANRAYMGQQGQLTPVSLSSGSRSVSPKTPIERPGAERTNGYFAPKIANDSPPAQSRRPGGYGGFNDDGYEDSLYPAAAPKKQAPNLLERMNTIAPGPFDAGRRPSLARGGSNDSTNDRPGTSASNMSSSFDSLKAAPRMPRKNGYGGFGPPPRTEDSGSERFGAPNRSETFPRPSETVEPPMRTPSAPSGSRPERLRRPSTSQERRPSTSSNDRPQLTSERSRRPSRGPDTSRPPPPRISTIPTPSVPSINLAAEFGIGNPYHTPSESTSSSSSSFSQRRPSAASSDRRPSQASSRSSPPRSVSSRAGRNASDTSGFDSLMADLQSSMSAPKALPLSPLQPPPIEKSGRGMPPARRPPPPERGYDPRIDPRGRQPVSPLSPSFDLSYDTASLSTSAPSLSPGYGAPPSPRWASPDRSRYRSRSGPREPERMRSQSRPRETERMRSQSRPREPERMRSQSRPRDNERARSQSRPRGGLTVPSSRGDCKACRLPITGKSISSADGRLTGRYHKACFVCAECKEPFSSSTFYVLDDRPYCEMDYHKLNGSVCGSCSLGIEGQYLEDESAVKHHVGCFRCGDCGMVLKDGYFEVNGKAFCEKDAWRRVQPPPMANGPMMGGAGSARRGPSNLNPGLPGGPRLAGGFGLPSGNRLGVPGPRPRMEKRMTRLGMM